ncbi:MAG: hypothetical protein HY283_05925 [Nitrospirae bacterium]|nr:hypothetical protein [Nitrospirota bacterium]
MTLLAKKAGLAFMLLLLPCVVFPPSARAGDWTMDFGVSVPDSNADGGLLVNRLEAGSLSTSTDLYDNASDVVALLAGPVQASFTHEGETTYPGYLQLLWRDIRAAGLPKSWTIKVVSQQSSSPVTVAWTAPPTIPSDSCHLGMVSFQDQTTGQLIDLNAASSYSYASNGTGGSPEIRLFTLTLNSISQNAPATPTGLESRSRKSYIQLRWTANKSTDLAGYYVWRSTSIGGGYVRLNTVPTLDYKYLDQNVVAGTAYHYVVTSAGTNGCESSFSQETVATAR